MVMTKSFFFVGMSEQRYTRIFRHMPEAKPEPPPQPLHELHTSDVKVFLTCRRQWHYSSPLELARETFTPNLNLWLGQLIHEALAVWYTTKSPKQTLESFEEQAEAGIDEILNMAISDKIVDAMQQNRDLGYAMLKHYMLYSNRHDRFEVIEVEKKVSVWLPFIDHTVITGKVDLVAADERGRIFIMDHKTSSRIPDEQSVQLDVQPWTYLFLMPDAEYFVFNFLYKREPNIPRKLKNGQLSKASLSDTTLEIYSRVLREVGQSWDAYPDVRLELMNQPNKFFTRYNVIKSKQALSLHARDLAAIGSEMLAPVKNIYPSPDWFKCNWCAYREPCMLESAGADPTPLLNANYRHRDWWY